MTSVLRDCQKAMTDLAIKQKNTGYYVLVACVLLLCATVITGCCSKESETTTEGPVTLVFWNTMEGAEAQTATEIVREFESQNPSIKIIVENIDFFEAKQKYIDAFENGSEPDLIRVDRFWLPKLEGLTAKLEGKKITEALGDMLPVAREIVAYKNHLRAVPISVDTLAMFYNKQHFKESQLDIPTNFDNFASIAEQLTDVPRGRYGFFLNPDSWFFEPFLVGFGGRYFCPQDNLAINSDATRRAIDFLLYMKNRLEAIRPLEIRPDNYQIMLNSFKTGQVSMIFSGPWTIRDILSGPEFRNNNNLGVAEIPSGPMGSFAPVGCQSLAISANSKNHQEALKFALYMFSPEVQRKLATANFGLPARQSIYADEFIKNDPYLRTFVRQIQMNVKLDKHPDQSRIYGLLTDKLSLIFDGQLTTEYALNDLVEEWEAGF